MNLTEMSQDELAELIERHTPEGIPDFQAWPYAEARRIRTAVYGRKVYLRGLIEFTNYCQMNCYYCGIRAANPKVQRYRLSQEQILECCRQGEALGFRTFVLQGGEDAWWDDERLGRLVKTIKGRWPHCAVTLSVGERKPESFRFLKDCGADRYLLRHETADSMFFGCLHPPRQTFHSRKVCLTQLQQAGFQTGAGFMVGAPGQTAEHLAADLVFLRELKPQMAGIGPFIPHPHTPFGQQPPGSAGQTLLMLALVRILLPAVLLPSTTALGSIHPQGRTMGLLAGANVVMPNLSPADVRAAYSLYQGKLHSGKEAAEGLAMLKQEIEAAGFCADLSRGDAVMPTFG